MKSALRQSVSAVICLCVVIALNFFLPRLMSGDPVLMLTGLDEDVVVTQERYDMHYEMLGLSDPVHVQFWRYLKALASGDLGYSYHHNAPVSELISERIPNTLRIAVPSLLISSALAMVLASFAGAKKNSPGDAAMTGFSIILNAIPGFLIAMVLVSVFSYSLGWTPFGGLASVNPPQGGAAEMLDRMRHLVLPVATLTLSGFPGMYLVLRNQVAAAANEKYVLYAKARGISPARVRLVHIFRNVCQPYITLVGLNVGFVLSGALIIENIFTIRGMGQLMMRAISARDFPTLQGCLFVTALAVILADIVTRFICVLIDPKVRYGVYETQ